MSTTLTDNTKERPMAALCRRREQLQAEGVRPDTLAWAVAEASEPALSVLEMSGPEMVRHCLAEARSAKRSGTEAEALVVLSAAGVGRLRAEARALGVGVPLNSHEAFREMRRTSKPQPAEALEAIRSLGARSVMETMCDRSVPFHRALAAQVATASRIGQPGRVKALCQVAAFGVWELRRGIRVDVDEELLGWDLESLTDILANDRPRAMLRERARTGEGEEAERFALLSFVQTGWLGRSVRAAGRRRQPLSRALYAAEEQRAQGRPRYASREVADQDGNQGAQVSPGGC
jgi:hypothetical protein